MQGLEHNLIKRVESEPIIIGGEEDRDKELKPDDLEKMNAVVIKDPVLARRYANLEHLFSDKKMIVLGCDHSQQAAEKYLYDNKEYLIRNRFDITVYHSQVIKGEKKEEIVQNKYQMQEFPIVGELMEQGVTVVGLNRYKPLLFELLSLREELARLDKMGQSDQIKINVANFVKKIQALPGYIAKIPMLPGGVSFGFSMFGWNRILLSSVQHCRNIDSALNIYLHSEKGKGSESCHTLLNCVDAYIHSRMQYYALIDADATQKIQEQLEVPVKKAVVIVDAAHAKSPEFARWMARLTLPPDESRAYLIERHDLFEATECAGSEASTKRSLISFPLALYEPDRYIEHFNRQNQQKMQDQQDSDEDYVFVGDIISSESRGDYVELDFSSGVKEKEKETIVQKNKCTMF